MTKRAMTQVPLWQASAVQLADLLSRRLCSASDVLDAVHQRLDEVNGALNALVTLNPRAAEEAAESDRRIAAGAARSPLEGVPVTIKDNLIARGMLATWGSRAYEHFIPDHDELPVQRIRDAGAVVIGKTNVPEFTVEGYTTNALFGTTRNPWNIDLTPGGSSGGAVAAVASGIAPIAIGTDGGGSIRRPAAYAGLVGLKPTLGRVARFGGFPRILIDMEVVGPMCRCVADVRMVFNVLNGAARHDQRSQLFAAPYRERGDQSGDRDRNNNRPLRILYVPQFGEEPVDAEITASVTAAACVLTDIGHDVRSGTLPVSISDITDAWPLIGQVGVSRLVRSLDVDIRTLGEQAQIMAQAGADIRARDFADVIETIEDFRTQVALAFNDVDLIVTPSAAALPWPAEQAYPRRINEQQVGPRGHAVFSGWVNACGHPAITLPCAASSSGLPIGIQLVADFGCDELLLDVAQQYETAAPWAERWPVLATSDAVNARQITP